MRAKNKSPPPTQVGEEYPHVIPFHSLQAPKSPPDPDPPSQQGRVKSDLQGFFGWGGTKRLTESTLRCWTGAPARWHVRQQAVTPFSQKAACSKSHHIASDTCRKNRAVLLAPARIRNERNVASELIREGVYA